MTRARKGEQVSEKKSDEKPRVTNEISDETGQFDMRFMLWRMFCAENDVPVETLPSDLTGEARDKWNALKDTKLK
ncbi:MAG TPA: hypothetical protein VGO96_03955 [Pyrinomonadaceae bacterium]|jgi:hypothetical protein|nr:hypothetical protein [Pyrinomonadaceae bacterium]